ncbi:hypothetical protein HSBAA_42160 [Vreelandella sulfidaeris]|uniref:CRISPR-associated exonuclease Cas4 n=1 Tax=Vreelandella sulfidaeris TaxID=115553 RepID=A0A455U9P2_9GAMM|nr:hypothetical protein HSBAA_42160 [Halomonas sulfidaeris]
MVLPLASEELGLSGIADVVEFDERQSPLTVRPIEYKRGRPKAHRADEVQLCAQALCLEEMLDIHIDSGALFYGKTRRRKDVVFDATLRTLTHRIIEQTRAIFDEQQTPQAIYDAKSVITAPLSIFANLKCLASSAPQANGLPANLMPWMSNANATTVKFTVHHHRRCLA